MARRLVIAYSPDRALTAEVLGKAIQHGRKQVSVDVEYVEVEGRGILYFRFDGLRYEEDEFPYIVAQLVNPPEPLSWREGFGGYEG